MRNKRSHDLVTLDTKIDLDSSQGKSPRVCPWNLRSSQYSITVEKSDSIPMIEETTHETPSRVDRTIDRRSTSISMTNFDSCLSKIEEDKESFQSPTYLSRAYILQRALSIQELEPSSWLSSSLMNLALSRFAREYSHARFMPIDFSLFISTEPNTKRGIGKEENTIDILGRIVSSKDRSVPIVIIFNMNNIHWNLIRIIFSPKPELQLFEPMGKPMSRHRGLSYRNIPRSVISWLDHVYPLANGVSWITIGESAITQQQQINSYDCGVACLLYAEKCGLGQVTSSWLNAACACLYLTFVSIES
jgi:hypothetical protein